MSEFDELENLFSDAFANEQVVPPKSVKQNIDSELFGSTGRLIWMFALVIIFLLPIGGVLFYSTIENANGQIAATTVIDAGSMESETNLKDLQNKSKKEEITANISEQQKTALENAGNSNYTEGEEGNSTYNTSAEQNEGESEAIEKGTTKADADNESNGKESFEQNNSLNASEGTKNLDGTIDITQNAEAAGRETVIEDVNTLLAIAQTEEIEEKPLPYDLLLMCATPNHPSKQRLPISLDVYAGVEKGFNNYDYTVQTFVAMDKNLTEDLGTSVSLEVSYPLTNRLSLASGMGMHRANNMFMRETSGVDSTYVGDTMIVTWYFDTVTQMQTSDTTITPLYDYNEFVNMESTFITRTSYFVPLYVKYEMPIGLRWSVGASAGVRFSYDHLKIGDNALNMTVNEFKRFGISTVFRPQVNFSTGQWKFGAYGQTGFDLIHGLSGDATRVRRLSLGGGLNFRYTF
ncbi:MAG: hypothetical protein ACO2Z9_03130 [Crocinitomicaceae bacterium]